VEIAMAAGWHASLADAGGAGVQNGINQYYMDADYDLYCLLVAKNYRYFAWFRSIHWQQR
jgi:hypothetical protein